MNYLECFNDILYNKVEPKNREYYGTDSGVNYCIIYGNLLKDIKKYILVKIMINLFITLFIS